MRTRRVKCVYSSNAFQIVARLITVKTTHIFLPE